MPQIALIKARIDSAIMAIANTKPQRNYLGASSIGKECDKEIWYAFHTPKRIEDPRVHRIMDYGHFSELYIVSLLKHAGYTLYIEDEDGKQFGFEDEEVAGSSDGVIMIDGEPYLFEAKSANDKRFREMERDGVEASNPVYYTQMQVYMHYLELKKALYFAINKNDGSIYMEIVNYEKIRATYAVNRGKEIIRKKEEEVERKYKSKAFFKCRYCSFRSECWAGEPESSKPPEEMSTSFAIGENFLLPK